MSSDVGDILAGLNSASKPSHHHYGATMALLHMQVWLDLALPKLAIAAQVAIFNGPAEAKGPVLTSHEAAQFDCIHLVRVVVKLLPTWLPDALFQVLQARWNSRQRLTRYTHSLCSSSSFLKCC